MRSTGNNALKRGCLRCWGLYWRGHVSINHQSKVLLVSFGRIPEFPVGLWSYLVFFVYPQHCSSLWPEDIVTLWRHVRHIDVNQLVPRILCSSCLQWKMWLQLLCSVSPRKQCWYQSLWHPGIFPWLLKHEGEETRANAYINLFPLVLKSKEWSFWIWMESSLPSTCPSLYELSSTGI